MQDNTLGDFLRAERARLGRTQRQIAGAADMSFAYLNDLELGRRRSVSPEIAVRLAGALEIPRERLAWLLVMLYGQRFGIDVGYFPDVLRAEGREEWQRQPVPEAQQGA